MDLPALPWGESLETEHMLSEQQRKGGGCFFNYYCCCLQQLLQVSTEFNATTSTREMITLKSLENQPMT